MERNTLFIHVFHDIRIEEKTKTQLWNLQRYCLKYKFYAVKLSLQRPKIFPFLKLMLCLVTLKSTYQPSSLIVKFVHFLFLKFYCVWLIKIKFSYILISKILEPFLLNKLYAAFTFLIYLMFRASFQNFFSFSKSIG